jgi:DNA translocase FtsK/SpoIIIE-like protein
MPTNRHNSPSAHREFSLTLQALTELKTDTSTPPSTGKSIPAAPALSDVLAEIGSLPAEALFLGMATDGLPVLLNLFDPHPGPILIAGDAGSGKTAFLQTMANAVAQTHNSDDLQFGVITNYPDEWERMEPVPHRLGVFPVGHNSTQAFVGSLATWAHSNRDTRQCILLFVDDLESVASLDLETLQNFRWLLLRGPARRVWPIVTLNAPRYGQALAWLQNFRTRIFGRVANGRIAEALSGDKGAGLDQLEARIQFSLREGNQRSTSQGGSAQNWLRFWLPSC